MLNFGTLTHKELLDTIPMEELCDFHELFEHSSRLLEPYSNEVLYICSCTYFRKHAICQHSTILSIFTGPRFKLPATLDERKIPKHARKDDKSLKFAERQRAKVSARRRKLVYTLLTSSEVCPSSLYPLPPSSLYSAPC